LDWLYWSQIAQGVGSLASALITLVIGVYVYKYTIRKDKLDFLYRTWEEQQQINLANLNSDANISSFEKMVYGEAFSPNVEEGRVQFQLFLMINRVVHLHYAKIFRIISDDEFEKYATPTLGLISRRKATVLKLLERGYSDDVRKEIERILSVAKPPSSPLDQT
jgi:hypothetical protein